MNKHSKNPKTLSNWERDVSEPDLNTLKKIMAFLTLEDLVGTVEVVVFPKDYEKNAHLIQEDEKVFIRGRVSAEDEKPSKLICEHIYSFREVPRELWVQFSGKEEYDKKVHKFYQLISQSDGNDTVVVFLKKERQMKRLPMSRNVKIDQMLVDILGNEYGNENVKVVEKSIEKQTHMH